MEVVQSNIIFYFGSTWRFLETLDIIDFCLLDTGLGLFLGTHVRGDP